MNDEQGKKTNPASDDAGVPAKPSTELSEQDLDKVAGGGSLNFGRAYLKEEFKIKP